jgi:hypothetical protein
VLHHRSNPLQEFTITALAKGNTDLMGLRKSTPTNAIELGLQSGIRHMLSIPSQIVVRADRNQMKGLKFF